jgi:peptidoglycan-N-acetylglucosamine deacetylase
MWILLAIGAAIVALAHTAPAPFILDAMAGDRAIWHMPRGEPLRVYLTYDDGPNPTTTPDLLDLLQREDVRATFFLIPQHVTGETAPIVRRMFAEGHAVALHSARKSEMLKTPAAMASTLTAAADRIEALAGSRPCRAFRPRGGWRSQSLYAALHQVDFALVGWGWKLWDVELFRPRTADRIVSRLENRIRSGDIIVMHDGSDAAPRRDMGQAVEATRRLIPLLRARGFIFDSVCRNTASTTGSTTSQTSVQLDRR